MEYFTVLAFILLMACIAAAVVTFIGMVGITAIWFTAISCWVVMVVFIRGLFRGFSS